MMATMSHLLYHLTRQLEDLSLKEVSARLAQYFLQRCEESHGQVAAGLSFELPVTKTHLAAYLGTISETLSRTLARFKALEVIQVDKSRITIQEPELLKNIAKGIKI
jgi:CRP/FNR family transcriptional regulator